MLTEQLSKEKDMLKRSIKGGVVDLNALNNFFEKLDTLSAPAKRKKSSVQEAKERFDQRFLKKIKS